MSTRGRSKVLGAVVLLVALAGCGSGGGSTPSATLPRPHGTATTTTTAHDRGLVGRCHLVSRQALRHHIDHSPAVPCSRPHNVETAGVHPIYTTLTKANIRSTLAGYGSTCSMDFVDYLRVNDDEHYRLWFVPMATTRSDGSWVIRCDLVVRKVLYRVRPFAVTTTALRAQARSGDTATWNFCADRTPSPGVPMVDCTKPHRYQYVVTLQTIIAHDDRYPSVADLRRRGTAACRAAVRRRSDAGSLEVAGVWTTRREWIRAGRPSMLSGSCFFSRRDHQDLPAIR